MVEDSGCDSGSTKANASTCSKTGYHSDTSGSDSKTCDAGHSGIRTKASCCSTTEACYSIGSYAGSTGCRS